MATLRLILIVIFLIAAIAITVVVLLQEGKSAGLGSMGGGNTGGGESYWDKNKKNSLEGKFEKWTKIMAGVLVGAAFILMFIPASAKKGDSNAELITPTTNVEASTAPEASTEPSATPEVSPEADAAE